MDRIIVVAENKPVFIEWCRAHDQDPRDKNFTFFRSYWSVAGLRSCEEYTLRLLLLHGWWKVVHLEVFPLNEYENQLGPNEQMMDLMTVFMKPWDEIEREAREYELTF